MRTRLLQLLITLLAVVLVMLGVPLGQNVAAAEQQKVVVDRIDDTARFASLAQYVTKRTTGSAPLIGKDERRETLQQELSRYHAVYGIKAGVFYRNGEPMARAPENWEIPETGDTREAFTTSLMSRRSHDPGQVWPWQDGRIVVASPVIRDGDVIAVVVTDSPTGEMRSRIQHGLLLIAAGEALAMLVAVAFALRLTGWVLTPVRVLDATTHDIATGRLKSRVAPAGGPPELRRLARSFNEMADHVQDVLEQQRAFVADASHQLRNPSPHCCSASSCSPWNSPRATRRSPPYAPRANAWPGSWTTCWTWPSPSTPPPTCTSPTSASSPRNAPPPGARSPRSTASAWRHTARPSPAGPTRSPSPARWTPSSTTP